MMEVQTHCRQRFSFYPMSDETPKLLWYLLLIQSLSLNLIFILKLFNTFFAVITCIKQCSHGCRLVWSKGISSYTAYGPFATFAAPFSSLLSSFIHALEFSLRTRQAYQAISQFYFRGNRWSPFINCFAIILSYRPSSVVAPLVFYVRF